METTHNCERMKVVEKLTSVNYCYKWEDSHGWGLYESYVLKSGYKWSNRCEWCNVYLPPIDYYKTDPATEHRCEMLIRNEWQAKKKAEDFFYIIEWNGYEWIYDCHGVQAGRMTACPFCNTQLANPNSYRNSWRFSEIILSQGIE